VNSEANIGLSYAQGPPAEHDSGQALYWLRRAAMHGHATAQKILRLMGDKGVYPSTFDASDTLRIQPAHAAPAMAHVCGPNIS
jgi:TPR repeat protein